MGYGSNIDWGWQAVYYVQSKLSYGATNRVEALYMGNIPRFGWMRMENMLNIIFADMPTYIERTAEIAKKWEVGNCMEQAAIAFDYLLKNTRARPLDYMSRTDINHAFVAIGRSETSNISDYKTWGDGCVVCDPWNNKAYLASLAPLWGESADFAAKSDYRVP